MRIDWRIGGPPARVVNRDTGEQLHYCAMADDVTGEYVQYAREGNRFKADPKTKRVLTVNGQANIEIQMLKPGEPYLLTGDPKKPR
jgi:hypothetical protein